MFVLMNLMCHCLQRESVLFIGMHRPKTPVKRMQEAVKSIAKPTSIPIAPLHAPLPKLMI
jgi:hypothetical protein